MNLAIDFVVVLFYALCESVLSLPIENTLISPKQVLVVSQMRSGSSFVGELFHQNPESFYLFEPLRALARANSNDNYSIFRAMKGVALEDATLDKTIADLLNCRFQEIPRYIFKDDFLLRTKYGTEFYNCVKRGQESENNFNKCLPVLIQNCKQSSIRTIKTVRLTLETADKVLSRLPNLKVLYLVRDPRAVIQSRISLNMVNDENVIEESRTFCKRMDNDLKVIKHSQNKNRIKIVQYEDAANDIVKVSKEIFDLIGLEIHSDDMKWIHSNSKRRYDGNPYSTSRNSAKSANHWISVIRPDTAKTVDTTCFHLYDKLGYKTFDEIKITK